MSAREQGQQGRGQDDLPDFDEMVQAMRDWVDQADSKLDALDDQRQQLLEKRDEAARLVGMPERDEQDEEDGEDDSGGEDEDVFDGGDEDEDEDEDTDEDEEDEE